MVVPKVIIDGVAGVVMGCRAVVTNTKNNKSVEAVVADGGPSNKLGEISLACAKTIGVPAGEGAKHPANSGGIVRQSARHSLSALSRCPSRSEWCDLSAAAQLGREHFELIGGTCCPAVDAGDLLPRSVLICKSCDDSRERSDARRCGRDPRSFPGAPGRGKAGRETVFCSGL